MEGAVLSLGIVVFAFACCALAGAVIGPTTARRAGAVAITIGLLPLPLAASLAPARAYAGLAATFCLMRVVEAWRSPPPIIPRSLGFVLPVDLATLRRGTARFDHATLLRGLVHTAVFGVGVALVTFRDATALPAVAAWAGGVLAVYGAIDALTSTIGVGLLLAGIESEPLQRHPVLARSVGEFWSDRWNRAVGAWLRRFFFRPVARRLGVRAGALAAFGFSGLFHAYLVLVSVGPLPALQMAGFFGVQALAIVLEQRLRITRWPAPAAHAWTIGWLLGASPLFVGPMLACFGVVVA